MNAETVRRAITGTINGRSRVARDDPVQAVTVSPLPGYAWHRLWGLDAPPGVREGDCVVQNGTRHAWRNTGDRPCRMAVVLVGAGGTLIHRRRTMNQQTANERGERPTVVLDPSELVAT
jgi:hypothetical protein